MLGNAYPKDAPGLLYPNAVVATDDTCVDIDIVVRGREGDVGCGFSMRPGVFADRSEKALRADKEIRAIADKLYAVGPPSQGPDSRGSDDEASRTWRADHVIRYQGDGADLICLQSLARLRTGSATTVNHAKLIPRSRCDIYAWPVTAYNDLDMGEAYSTEYLPPGEGKPPFGSTDAKPMLLSNIDQGTRPSRSLPVEFPSEGLKRIEVQSESTEARDRLGFLSVQFFVFEGSNPPPVGTGGELSLQVRFAAACPRKRG
jgi:hypothetical protein